MIRGFEVQGNEAGTDHSSEAHSPWSIITNNEQTFRGTSGSLGAPSEPELLHKRRRRRDMFSLHGRGALNIASSPSARHQRVRPSLHRVINALFSSANSSSGSCSSIEGKSTSVSTPTRRNSVTQQTIPEHSTISPTSTWGNNSDVTQTSYANLELVGPGAFLFSSPTLGDHASLVDAPRSQSTSSQNLALLHRQGSGTTSCDGCTRSGSFSTTTEETLDDFVLEPYQEFELTRSLSDVLLRIDGSNHAETDGWTSHCACPTEEFLETGGPNYPAELQISLPFSLLKYLFSFLSSENYNSLRQTCRGWKYTIDSLHPLIPTAAQRLPVELVQHIFGFLNPLDFNASRHTCRTWMMASLDINLLSLMLKRGGWWSGFESSPNYRSTNPKTQSISREWLASCLLSRECALRPDWTGNGLTDCSGKPPFTPISLVSCTDFSALESYNNSSIEITVFTVSVCSKYILVAHGRIIRIYGLNNKTINPLTSIICPRRVLAMSMDSSSGRFAVAALLECRMGMVCDLQFRNTSIDASGPGAGSISSEFLPEEHNQASIFVGRQSLDSEWASLIDRGANWDSQQGDSSDSLDGYVPPFDAINVHNGNGDFTLLNSETNRERSWVTRAWNISLRGPRTITSSNNSNSGEPSGPLSEIDPGQTISIESGPRNIYRHLCSDDDPPRSVAICPQRRCVAFGCSAGIELHWVDALTGQDMNRWFPLTAPSDVLYFLPPRRDVDSARKLRIISSAVHPADRPSLCERFFANRPSLSAFWGAFGMENRIVPLPSTITNYDHYRAVPLSDGFHIMFTEPVTNALCMGGDASLGGLNKLLRKVVFIPPQPGFVPKIYTTVHDLQYGARVIAAFEETIMLYCVPPDILAISEAEQLVTEARYERDAPQDCIEWWPNDHADSLGLQDGHPIWPLYLRGVQIGTVPELSDLAINYSPELTIWAFDKGGQAYTWSLVATPFLEPVQKHRIGRNGRVAETFNIDADGDVIMWDSAH